MNPRPFALACFFALVLVGAWLMLSPFVALDLGAR